MNPPFEDAIDGTGFRVASVRMCMSLSGSAGDVYAETLAVFDQREDPFEPLTTPEVADSLDAARRTVYKRLEILVERSELKTKKVGANARVWWRSPRRSSENPENIDGKYQRFEPESPRDRLEQELRIEKEHFRVALENSPIVAFRLDTDLRYTWIANPHQDFDPDDVLGKRDDELLPPDVAETIMEPKRRALETGERVREEVTYEVPSGTVTYDLTVAPLRDETGEIIGLTAASMDLTGHKEAEEALRKSEEGLRLALEAGKLGAWELNLQTGESPDRSPLHDRIFGYDELEDWSFERFIDHVHPDDRDRVRRSFDEAFEEGEWTFECRIIRADDVQRWISAQGEFYFDDGEPIRAVGVVQDITERKERERELQEYRRQYRTLIENFPSGAVALVDEELRYVAFGGTPEGETDLTRADLEGEYVRDVLPPQIAEVVVPRHEAALDGEAATFEATIDERVYEFHFLPVRDEQGDVFAVTAMSQDITERTERERQLAESRNRYRTLIENFPNGLVALFDADLRYLIAGGQFYEGINRDPAETVGSTLYDVATPEQIEILEPHYRATLNGELRSFEIAHDDRTLRGWTVPVRDEEGDVFAGMAMFQDITELKDRQRELEESQRRYQTLVDNFPNGIVTLFDEDFRYLVAGGQLYEAFDRSPDETVGKTLYERSTPEEIENLEPAYDAALDGEASSFELEWGGRVLQFHVVPVTDEEGNVFAGMAMSQDITERKRREAELEQYKTIVETAEDAVYFVDDDHRFVLVNDAYCDLVGRSREELLGEHITVVVSEDVAQTARDLRAEAADKGTESEKFEMDFVTSDGEVRTTEVNYSYFRDEAGTIKGVAGIIRDVTERQRREAELAALNRLNQVFQEVTDAIIESSSRAEIEQTITEHLTNSDSYEYAWIGHLDRHGENIIPQTAGTDEVDRSEIPLSTVSGNPTSQPPAVEAIRTGDVTVTTDSITDPVFDQWAQSQDIHCRAAISIPITYEDRVYGVLNVYTARENAFDEHERHLIGRLGEVVGHAIKAIERKRALLEDRVQEITFQSQRFAEIFTEAAGDESFTISIEKFVPLPDDRSIAYYSLDGLDPAVFVDVIETYNPDAEYRVTDEDGSRARVEVQGSNLSLASRLATYNSQIVDGTLQNGEFRLRVQVPRHSHVRAVKDIVKEAYPDVEVVAQTGVEQENLRLSDVFSDLDDQLTERQRTTLEVGYYSGFFDWPRAITGEELAERLDVTPGTVSHHLRHGERKLMEAFFESTA